MSDLNTEIKIGADASGVEAGVGKAKRSLASLGDTAKKAGQDAAAGLSGIGTGGDASAKKVESATRSMQASLQRLVAEQKAGSKSSREYWEALANARGVSASSIKPLLDQLDAAKTKTIEAKTASEGWTASLGKVGPVLAAAFSGAAVLNFTGKLVAVQREFDVLNSSLITVTGSSAKAAREMDWIRKFAATTPYQLSEVTQAFVKMKSLGLDASEASLRSYGNTASAMGKNINQMIEAVADAATGEFERLKEFGIKAKKDGDEVSLTFRGMTTTIGNSAEEITRYLRQIGDVDFASAMNERAKTLDGAISNLADSWANLQLAISQGGVGGAIANESRAISNDLSAIADAMTASAAKGEGAFMQLANAAGVVAGRSAFGALALVANATNGSLNYLSGGILSLNTNLDLLPDNLRPVSVQMDLMGKKLDQARGEYDKLAARLAQAPDNIYIKSELNQLDQYIKKLEEATKKQRQMQGALASIDGLDFRAESAKFARQAIVPKAPEAGKKTPAGGSRSSAADAAAREIAEQSKLLAELSGLTASFSADWDRLSAIYAKGQLSLEGLTDAQAKLLEKQPFAVALAREETAAQQALAKAREADAKAYEATVGAAEKAVGSVADRIRALQQEAQVSDMVRTLKISEAEAVELLSIARLREKATIIEMFDPRAQELAHLKDEIAQRERLVDLLGQKRVVDTTNTAAKEAADAWQKTADSIESSLTDALMRGFENGKGFGENLGDSLSNYFKTVVAREIATAITRAIMSAMASTQWGQLLSGVLGGGSGGTNWIDMATKAYDAYTKGGAGGGVGGAGGVAAAGGAYATTGGTGYAAGTTASYSAGSVSAGAGMVNTAGSTAGTAGTSMMTYAGYAALIVAAIKVAENLYSTGYNRTALGVSSNKAGDNNSLGQYTYGTGNTTTGDSGARNWMSNGILALEATNQRRLMDAVGMNEKWADIFSGTVRMATLIGRKLKGYGYQVNISGADVDVRGYEYYKGGLFRSNKTVTSDVNSQDAEDLREGIENVRESARGMAKAMGYSTEAIDNYSSSLRINLKGVNSGEEAAQRLAEEMDKMYYGMLRSASGGKLSKDAFSELMESIRADIEAAGISTQGIGSTLAQGAIGRMTESQVGEALSESIIGGIYNTIASNAMAPVAEAFMGQIITPIFTAIMAGVPISQALSQAAIDNVVASAQRASAVLNAVFADPGFQSAIAGIQGAISSIARVSVSSAKHVRSYGSAVSAAAQKAQAAAQERYGLETQLLNLLGNTAKLRERELNALNAGNRALQLRIWSVEDAKAGMESAMDALQRAIEAERDRVNTSLDAARDLESSLNDLFALLRENVRELRGEVEATTTMQAEAARNLLRAAIAGGTLPDSDTLRDAISAARSGVDAGRYGSALDRDRATLTLANELERLQALVQPRLSDAERTVLLLETQIEAMDLQLQTATDQMNALLGIDSSVKTVANAVDALSVSMAAYAAAVAAASSTPVSSAPPPQSTTPVSSGSYSAPKPVSSTPSWWASWNSDGYWNKNADLRDYWAREGAALSKLPQFNLDPKATALQEYLLWHYQNHGIKEGRKFARGGFYPGGMALVGEEGPELINFRQPGQVYTAAQTADLLRGDASSAELVRELRALREEQRAQAAAMVQMQQKLNKIVGRWDTAGLPEERVTA